MPSPTPAPDLFKTQNFNIANEAVGKLPWVTQETIGEEGYKLGFVAFLSRILGAVIPIALLMVLVFLLWGAIEWIGAGGESGKLQKAREKIVGAIVGLIVLISSLALFMLIQEITGTCILEFGPIECTEGTDGGTRTGVILTPGPTIRLSPTSP